MIDAATRDRTSRGLASRWRGGSAWAGLALVDRCCHRGPLKGELVPAGMCGYHGLVFDGSGRCVAVPGQANVSASVRVRSYPLVEKNQFVWIWMGEAAAADASKIVDFPYHDDKAQWPNKHDCYPISANYMLMVDNLMDLTHLGYLHAKTVGGNPAAHVNAEMQTTRTATGIKFTRWMRNSVPPPSYVKAAGFKGRVDRSRASTSGATKDWAEARQYEDVESGADALQRAAGDRPCWWAVPGRPTERPPRRRASNIIVDTNAKAIERMLAEEAARRHTGGARRTLELRQPDSTAVHHAVARVLELRHRTQGAQRHGAVV